MQGMYMKDKYIDGFLKSIKEDLTDEELKIILNKLYEDGFLDGHAEGLKDSKKGDFNDAMRASKRHK